MTRALLDWLPEVVAQLWPCQVHQLQGTSNPLRQVSKTTGMQRRRFSGPMRKMKRLV